jgi:hypothetical protein
MVEDKEERCKDKEEGRRIKRKSGRGSERERGVKGEWDHLRSTFQRAEMKSIPQVDSLPSKS